MLKRYGHDGAGGEVVDDRQQICTAHTGKPLTQSLGRDRRAEPQPIAAEAGRELGVALVGAYCATEAMCKGFRQFRRRRRLVRETRELGPRSAASCTTSMRVIARTASAD